MNLKEDWRALLAVALNIVAILAISFSDNLTVQIAGAGLLPFAGYLFFSGVGARHDSPP